MQAASDAMKKMKSEHLDAITEMETSCATLQLYHSWEITIMFWYSLLIGSYKQMQQETQEYFMKSPPFSTFFNIFLLISSVQPPGQINCSLRLSQPMTVKHITIVFLKTEDSDRYVAELNEAARRREAKHKDRLQQVQSSISSCDP